MEKSKKILLAIMAIMLPVIAITAQTGLQEGLIAYYPFNGDANDESGNNHHGIVEGATLTSDRFGNSNSAYAFDGDNDYIVVKEAPVFNFEKSGYTILLWVKISSGQIYSYPRIMGFGGYADKGWDIELGTNHNIMAFNINSSSGDGCSKYVDIELNRWIQYAVVYKNDTIKTFVNGMYLNFQYCPDYYQASGFDLIIGASSDGLKNEFVGELDDISMYNRALSDIEVALSSGNKGAVYATQKGAAFYADFENGFFESYNKGNGLDLYNGGSIRIVENPEKDNVNSSNYVLMTTSKESDVADYSRAEYTTEWDAPFKTLNRKHIYQWMVYFPEDYLDNVQINGNWHLITQFVTHPCANGEDDFRDVICGSGGIFNELRINRDNYSEYNFEYRADPDCNKVNYEYPKGQWIKFTYEIFWTTESTGYYKVWADEKLLGEAENVHTLPKGFIEGTCDIRWKVGLYDSWRSDNVDSVYYYIDNLELYVDGDVEEVFSNQPESIKLLPNPAADKVQIVGLPGMVDVAIYDIKGNLLKSFTTQNEFSVSDLKQGLYIVQLRKNGMKVSRKIVKE